METERKVPVGALGEGQRFKCEPDVVGLVLSRSLDPDTGEPQGVRVRTWATKDVKLVKIGGREFRALKSGDGSWSVSAPVVPITPEEFRVLSSVHPAQGTIEGREEEAPDTDLAPRGEPAPEPVTTPAEREGLGLANARVVAVEIVPPPPSRSACICGCGEYVEGTLKRGHFMRLRGWASRYKAGKVRLEDIPKAAVPFMMEHGLLTKGGK